MRLSSKIELEASHIYNTRVSDLMHGWAEEARILEGRCAISAQDYKQALNKIIYLQDKIDEYCAAWQEGIRYEQYMAQKKGEGDA